MRAAEAQLQQLDLHSVLSGLFPVHESFHLISLTYMSAAQPNITSVFRCPL